MDKRFITIFLVISLISFIFANKPTFAVNVEIIPINYDLVVKNCNITYVYAPKQIIINNTKYNTTFSFDVEDDYIYNYDIKNPPYKKLDDIEVFVTYKWNQVVSNVYKEAQYIKSKLYNETGISIAVITTNHYIMPISLIIETYDGLDQNKINKILEYYQPLIEKYNIYKIYISESLYLFDDISPSTTDKDKIPWAEQFRSLVKYFGENYQYTVGYNEYINLAEKYGYHVIQAPVGISATSITLPELKEVEAYKNIAFLQDVVKLVRKYAGCLAPLEINFASPKVILLNDTLNENSLNNSTNVINTTNEFQANVMNILQNNLEIIILIVTLISLSITILYIKSRTRK